MTCRGRCEDGTCFWCDMTPCEKTEYRNEQYRTEFERAENERMKAYFKPESVKAREEARNKEIAEYMAKNPNVSEMQAFIALYD